MTARMTPAVAPMAPSSEPSRRNWRRMPERRIAHGARRADLVGALHHRHGHGVDHGEKHDDAHDHGDEEEDRAEEIDDLQIVGGELGEVAHLELEPLFLEEAPEAGARGAHVGRPVQLQHDPRHLVLAAAVEQLLRQRQMHADIVVVELLDRERLGAAQIEAHHIGRAARGRGEKIDARHALSRMRLLRRCRLAPGR